MSNQIHEASAPTGLREYLLQLMKERRIPGIQVAICRDGKIECLDALGMADIEHRVPTNPESVFSIISMAKAFTGVALMQLVEAGQLDLRASVSAYLDGLPESWRPVTVRQLATFTSGLPEIMTIAADFSMGLIGGGGEQEAWEAAFELPMEFAPGEGYRYVQTNYALLGKIIDRLSGKPFTEFIAERQFAAAGMSHTLFANDTDIIPNRANSYMSINAAGATAATLSNSCINCPPMLRTAAGLYSTAGDLAHWIIAIQRRSLLGQASSLETLCTRVPLHDGRPGLWGLGWPIGKSCAGHISAVSGGAKAQIALYPDGLAVVLLANLIGAFPEQFAPITGGEIDLAFIDPIARHYAS